MDNAEKDAIRTIIKKIRKELLGLEEIVGDSQPATPHPQFPFKEVSIPNYVIIIGHANTAQGAYSEGLAKTEYGFNSDVADKMLELHNKAGFLKAAFDLSVVTRDGKTIRQAYQEALETEPEAIIELHFNSFFSNDANGMEVLINQAAPDKTADLASTFLTHLKLDFEFRNRGIKRVKLGQRGYHNVTYADDVPSILIEPFFGSSPSDVAKLKTGGGVDGLAKSYLDALYTFTTVEPIKYSSNEPNIV